jgi:hypothetical protein
VDCGFLNAKKRRARGSGFKGFKDGFIGLISSIGSIGWLWRPAACFIGSIGLICSIGSVNQLINLSGYPERTSGIKCGIPAAGDHLNSRLEAAPTESLSNGNLDFPDKQVNLFN